MKNTFFYLMIFFLIGQGYSFAQNGFTDNRTNLSKRENFCEGGMNIYRLDYEGVDGFFTSNGKIKPWMHSFFRGVNFKYFFGKNAIRASFEYFKKEDYYSDWESYNSRGISKTGILTLGYQRVFRKARFSPYFFADLSAQYTSRKGTENYNGYHYGIAQYYGTREYAKRNYIYAVAPGFGLRYNPVKSIVLSLEMNVQCYFSLFRDVRNGGRPYNDWGFKFNPLQCGMAFIF